MATNNPQLEPEPSPRTLRREHAFLIRRQREAGNGGLRSTAEGTHWDRQLVTHGKQVGRERCVSEHAMQAPSSMENSALSSLSDSRRSACCNAFSTKRASSADRTRTAT